MWVFQKKSEAGTRQSACPQQQSMPDHCSFQKKSYFSPLQTFQPEVSRKLHMPAGLLDSMQNAYQADFSRMQFYESPTLPVIQAKAITQGARSYFAPGCFSPESPAGQKLIGHELSHAAAQARGIGTGPGLLFQAGLESQADREGDLAARGEKVCQAPITTAGLRADAPVQGYFLIRPGDYTLNSDGSRAAFTTHTYKNVDPSNPLDTTLADYANEFTAPTAQGVLAAVAGIDPGSGDAAIADLHQADQDSQTASSSALMSKRLLAHRRLSDQYAVTLGSNNPTFRQNISADQAAPGHPSRNAAIGVYQYVGKTAIYVADDASFAVNSQTPEPKEAYMIPTAIAQASGRGGNITFVPFPGNQIVIPPPAGSSTPLRMVRPSFGGNYAAGNTFDCGDFARKVCPQISVGIGASSVPDEIPIERTSPAKAMARAGMAWFQGTAYIKKLVSKVISNDTGDTLTKLEQYKADIPAHRPGSYPADDFKSVFDVFIRDQLKNRIFSQDGYSATGQDLENGVWGNVRRPNDPHAGPASGLDSLQGQARTGIKEMLGRIYEAEVKNVYARCMAGDSTLSAQTDTQHVIDEETQYGSADQLRRLNAHAKPAAGRAYKITTSLGDGWVYHWGAVIAASGGDTLTLENYHKASELQVLRLEFAKEQENLLAQGTAPNAPAMQALLTQQSGKYASYEAELKKTWFFNIQGTIHPGQSFHAKQAATGAYGVSSVTMVE